MPKPAYDSRVKTVKSYTTAKGGSYIKNFDVVRSERGRAVIERHAELPTTNERKAESVEPQQTPKSLKPVM